MANEQTIANLIVRLSAQTTELTSGLKRAETEVRTFQTGITSTVRGIGVGLAGMFGAFAAFASIRQAAAEAREFGKAMAEVSTLLPKEADMRPLVEGAKESAKNFGGSPREQAKAYYQIISAGATDATQATAILTAANKLAVGGVTSVATAADGLTTILNAYGIEASRSEEVTDAMFVAMRAGKTTIGELSSSIGKVAPIAAQTGVALDDLLSAIAALSKGGIETTVAAQGVRAVLAAIAKPSTEAADLSAQLGINFSAAGLKAKGFAGFLAEVKEKTGGSTESLAKLFGGVEALVPVMALAGNAGKDYAAILGSMATKAGQTEEAFAKMSQDVSFKLDQLKASFTVLAITGGEKFLNAILPAVTAVVKHFDSIVKGVQLLSAAIASRLVTAVVVYNIQLAQSIVQGLRATAVLAGYSSSALLAAVRIRAAGLAANIAAGQFGVLSGALALLGGPIGFIITGLTVAATAWTLFGQKAKEGGDSAIDEIHKMVEEFGKVSAPHQAILDAIQKETAAIEAQSVRLRVMREDINKNASAADSMMLAMGDVGAANNLKDIDRQLDANAAKMRRLAEERIALEEKVRKAGEAKAVETKPPPIAITSPEVLAARHKANLKISQAAAAEELVVLEDSYKQGQISLEAYYERRKAILSEKIREEVALLKKEQGAKETKPERKEEIRAEVFALESAGRTEVIKVTREQADAYKALWAAIGEGDLAGFVAKNDLLMNDLENRFADGLVATEDYFNVRRRIIEENAAAAVTNVEDQIVPGMDPAAKEAAANRIKAIRAQMKADLQKADREEVEQVRTNEEEKLRIVMEFAQLKVDAATNEGERFLAQQELERASLEARLAQQYEMIAQSKEDLIELDGEFYEKEDALVELAEQQALARQQLQVEQAKAVFQMKLQGMQQVFGAWSQAMGAMYEATGGKIKAFFVMQKAFSIAETTIKTYEAAMKAYSAMASIPYVGPALGAAAAAAAIAFGLAQVAIIAKQKAPGMEAGGMIRGGSGTRDDVPIIAMGGEYVIRKRAADYYGPKTLEAINRMLLPKSSLAGARSFQVSIPEGRFQAGGLVAPPRESGAGGDRQAGRLTQLVVDGRVFGEWFMDEVAFGRIKLVPR